MSSNSNVLSYFLPNSILLEIFSKLLSVNDICRFDSAICNKHGRLQFLEVIGSEYCILKGDQYQDFSSVAVSWLKSRSIKIRYLKCTRITDDIAIKIASIGSWLHWLSFNDNNKNRRKRVVTDTGIVKTVEGCPNLHTLNMSFCNDITDISVIKVAEGCPNLHTIDLEGCSHITNTSIKRVAKSSHNLQILDVSRCRNITEPSLTSIVDQCPNLKVMNLDGCNVSELGLLRLHRRGKYSVYVQIL
jgi:F-box/leucine-rich repeat protein 2/20